MYKSLGKKDYLRILSLPEDYKVDGVLSYGHYNLEKQMDRVKNALTKLKIDCKITQLDGYLKNIYEIKTSKSTFWFTVVYGGVTLCEHLHFACLFGSKKNIHIGSCGGLYSEMEALDYLVPNWSYGNESSTRLYDRKNTENKHYPDKELSKKIKEKLAGKKVWEGPIITCAAMTGETKEDIDKWGKEGYYGVEMETSTVFALSKHFNVPSASLVYVADNLVKGQVVGDKDYEKQKQARADKSQEMVDVAVEILIS